MGPVAEKKNLFQNRIGITDNFESILIIALKGTVRKYFGKTKVTICKC